MIGRTAGPLSLLGHYRVLQKIGEGGMGVVYRARDERLERDVALKVLPTGALADESARKRFREEALALSHLNHPNIAAAYDFDTQDGIDFLVTEFVPGLTLDQKLASGALPEKEAVQIGLQLAEGLDAAHHEGVIHRDLKPSNVRLTCDGRVKILDFGLAKRLDIGHNESRTQSIPEADGVAGTLAYMAPEQLKGAKIDARADVWAVGVVLYELATGRHPFGGKTTTGLADDILHLAATSPQISHPRLSGRLADLILKCLEKEADNRYQSAKELAVDLRRLAQPTSTVVAPSLQRHRPRRTAIAVITAVVALAISAYYLRQSSLATLILRQSQAPAYEPIAFTTMQGVISEPTFSPDGNEIAFWWQKRDPADRRIYVQALGNTVARQLVEDPEANHIESSPRWFPDGRSIGYIRKTAQGTEEIWTVPRTGGTPRKLLGFPRLIDFDVAPDGDRIVTAEAGHNEEISSLYLISLPTMTRQRLTHPPEDKPSSVAAGRAGDLVPRFSPDGRSIAFIRYQGAAADLFLLPARGGEAERLTDDLIIGAQALPNYAWDPDGKSVLVVAARKGPAIRHGWWRLRLRDKRWEALSISPGSFPTICRDGQRLAFVQPFSITNIWRYQLPGHNSAPVNLTQSTSTNWGPSYSPDGNRFVFTSSRTGHYEIYVANRDGSNPVQLTSFQSNDAGSPRWSPDGKQIAFDYRPAKQAQIFVIDANGGPAQQMTFGDADNVLPRYSKDGRWIYFARLRKGGSDVWKVPSSGGDPAIVAADGLVAEQSTDGTALYYTKSSDKHIAIYRRATPGGEEQRVFEELGDVIGGVNPFVVVSDGIYYRRKFGDSPGHELLFYDFAKRRSQVLLRFPFQGVTAVSISPDRASLLTAVPELQTNIMLVESFAKSASK